MAQALYQHLANDGLQEWQSGARTLKESELLPDRSLTCEKECFGVFTLTTKLE